MLRPGDRAHPGPVCGVLLTGSLCLTDLACIAVYPGEYFGYLFFCEVGDHFEGIEWVVLEVIKLLQSLRDLVLVKCLLFAENVARVQVRVGEQRANPYEHCHSVLLGLLPCRVISDGFEICSPEPHPEVKRPSAWEITRAAV